MYVGRSIHLYARIRSYFYKTSKYKGVSLIRNYFNKHGFDSVRLIIFMLPKKYTFNKLVNAGQGFLDFFKPSLNLDSKATPSRYNAPMGSQTYKQCVKQRSHYIAVFDRTTNQLLWVFQSKQQCTTLMGIHHSTLTKCINTNTAYLGRFKFSIINRNSK